MIKASIQCDQSHRYQHVYRACLWENRKVGKTSSIKLKTNGRTERSTFTDSASRQNNGFSAEGMSAYII